MSLNGRKYKREIIAIIKIIIKIISKVKTKFSNFFRKKRSRSLAHSNLYDFILFATGNKVTASIG